MSGKVITLKVDTSDEGIVYPILAGAAFETSYEAPYVIEGIESNEEKYWAEQRVRWQEEWEALEQEKKAQEEAAWKALEEGATGSEEGGEELPAPPPPASGHFSLQEVEHLLEDRPRGKSSVQVPEPPPPGAATASSLRVETVKPFKDCNSESCNIWLAEVSNPSYYYGRDSHSHKTFAEWEFGTQVHDRTYYPWYNAESVSVESNGCGKIGAELVLGGEGNHLTAWARFTVHGTGVSPTGDSLTRDNYLALQIWVWPNGEQVKVITHWDGSFHPNPCAS